ncbi:MAG: riboflavin synthase subunit alpha [Natronospirillum sp.]
MFTGIVQGKAQLIHLRQDQDLVRLAAEFPSGAIESVRQGASVALDGVCLTVTGREGRTAFFDVMRTTLEITTLGQRREGDWVNFERAMRASDEVGGHLLSGHVAAVGVIISINELGHGRLINLQLPSALMPYVFAKGYIGVDGASLTIVERLVDGFSVSLIPETLALTTLGEALVGTRVNIEIDSQTRAVVDTVERVLAERAPSDER